jgi:hypothetical protein
MQIPNDIWVKSQFTSRFGRTKLQRDTASMKPQAALGQPVRGGIERWAQDQADLFKFESCTHLVLHISSREFLAGYLLFPNLGWAE